MTTPSTDQNFIIFCGMESTSNADKRQFAVRKYMKKRLGADVKILHEIATPDHNASGLTIVVEASTIEVVMTALAAFEGSFAFQVSPVVIKTSRVKAGEMPKYAVFLPRMPEVAASLKAVDSDDVGLWLKLPETASFSDVLLLDTVTFGAAREFVEELAPGARVVSQHCFSLAALVAQVTGDKNVSIDQPLDIDHTLSVAVGSSQLISRRYDSFYAPMVDEKYPFNSSVVLGTAAKDVSTHIGNQSVFVWPKYNYPIWNFRRFVWSNSYYGSYVVKPWVLPRGIIPASDNDTTYVVEARENHAYVDGDQYTFSVQNKLSIWLNDLMATPKYDAVWPEDSYSGGSKLAYDYIVSFLPGKTEPKTGSNLDSGLISAVEYSPDLGFTEAEFLVVRSHLVREVTYFAKADKWFGIDGIMDAVNRSVAILSANDLTEAAELMSIPIETTDIISILEDIFGAIISIVAIIPGAGPVLAASLTVAWTVVKDTVPGMPVNAPINATVAEMAGELNKYLIKMQKAAEIQKLRLFANFGRLEAFSDGVVEGIISEDKFFSGLANADGSDKGRIHDVGVQVGDAAANAWLVYCYKRLFGVAHTVTSVLSFSDKRPVNPWDPAKGQYRYTWSMPCEYIDVCDLTVHTGFAIVDGTTSAPPIIMQKLFGADSPLTVFPIAFFAGFNGWQTLGPAWDTNWAAFPGTKMRKIPINRIGMPQWNALEMTDPPK
ncbi:hypothetical protein GCM10011309_16200 [Litorimonas cladophorae]|uniref:Uncharacterized protein n=1 Tax=Litorimonas cladophorae TaxID=1220491 RepID=A0A918KKW0_9PROT|nr:hypothetical protein [Litorimonas cladophorae]GGX67293.1 hypothetical protein GCM10011309_16200 [Litorimonas cladophorae]